MDKLAMRRDLVAQFRSEPEGARREELRNLLDALIASDDAPTLSGGGATEVALAVADAAVSAARAVAAADPSPPAATTPFVAAQRFYGATPGYLFGNGAQGAGYYRNAGGVNTPSGEAIRAAERGMISPPPPPTVIIPSYAKAEAARVTLAGGEQDDIFTTVSGIATALREGDEATVARSSDTVAAFLAECVEMMTQQRARAEFAARANMRSENALIESVRDEIAAEFANFEMRAIRIAHKCRTQVNLLGKPGGALKFRIAVLSSVHQLLTELNSQLLATERLQQDAAQFEVMKGVDDYVRRVTQT